MYTPSASETHIHTHTQHSLSVSVMHYRPLSYFGVSSGLNLLSTKTHTHACCGHADLLACRTRLDFQYGFFLQHSLRSIRPPVSVNVIRLVCLLPACRFLCFSCLSFFFTFDPTSLPLYCSWFNALLGFFSAHLCCVLIHFTKRSLRGKPFPMFLI